MSDSKARPAFAVDALTQRGLATAKALWWGATGTAAKALLRERDAAPVRANAPPPPRERLRAAYFTAFAKDARDVAEGLYPAVEDEPSDPVAAFRRAADFLSDAKAVDARRRRKGGVEAREGADSEAYPVYYRQNFHYQSGGWFTEDSARRYESQVEALFSGTAGAMRRRALSLLAKAWRGHDHRGLRVVDIACGAGSFLADLKATFPRAKIAGLDLSGAYLAQARRRSGVEAAVQANAERLPFADASLDAVTCIYLFHELPPKVRPVVAAEIARVLKPGGVLAFADSVQPIDEPELARLLEVFPAFFHEPYYATYSETDLPALFEGAGLVLKGEDKAFLTKALLFEKL